MGCSDSNSLKEIAGNDGKKENDDKKENVDIKENNDIKENDDIKENNDFIEDVIDQGLINKRESISLTNNILLNKKAKSSICKIIIDNKIGNGFFCKFKYYNNNIIYLMTCYHVINKETLDFYDEIELIFNNSSHKLNLKEKRIAWYNKDLDFVALEIKNEDKMNVLDTFEIDDNCYNYEYDNNEYNNRGIMVPCFDDNNKIIFPYGTIINSNAIKFRHDCNTKPGNSGAPVVLVNNIKIIGIHSGYSGQSKKNIGNFFQYILKYINNEKNKIGIIIEIDEIKNIKLINQTKNINIYKDNEKIILKEDNTYDFDQKGQYNFTIIINNNMTDCSYLFDSCDSLISVDLSNFDSCKVNNFECMFSKCHKLKEIKGLEKLNTSNALNMSKMFQACKELQYLDLSNFDTSKVTNMYYIFGGCNKLKVIKGLENLNTSNVTNMYDMFGTCYELESLDLSNFDTSKVNNMSLMFDECIKLKEIKGLENFNTTNVIDMSAMFQDCKELKYLN